MTLHARLSTRTAAGVLVDQLVLQGVSHVFCIPGEKATYRCWMALVDSSIKVSHCLPQ